MACFYVPFVIQLRNEEHIMRLQTAALLSVIAVTACKKQKPDEVWAPGSQPQADSPPQSAETVPAGTLPPTSPESAKPGDGMPTMDIVVGTIAAVEEKPIILRNTNPIDAAVGTSVKAGDKITTGAKTKIRISMTDGSILAIGPRSSLTIARYDASGDKRTGSIRVAIGAFWMQVTKWAKPTESFIEIETPNAVAGIRGTTVWGDTQRGVVCALEGTVAVRSVSGKALPTSLTAGNCVSELDAAKLTPLVPAADAVQQYLDEVLIK